MGGSPSTRALRRLAAAAPAGAVAGGSIEDSVLRVERTETAVPDGSPQSNGPPRSAAAELTLSEARSTRTGTASWTGVPWRTRRAPPRELGGVSQQHDFRRRACPGGERRVELADDRG